MLVFFFLFLFFGYITTLQPQAEAKHIWQDWLEESHAD